MNVYGIILWLTSTCSSKDAIPPKTSIHEALLEEIAWNWNRVTSLSDCRKFTYVLWLMLYILMNHFLVILLFLCVIKFRILIMHVIIIYSLSMIKHARYTYHDGFIWIGNFLRVIIRYSLQVQVFILSHSTGLILRIPYNLSHHFVFLLSRNIRNVQMLIIINKPWIKWFQIKIKD